MINHITTIARDVFNSTINESGEGDAPFHMLVDVTIDGVTKPLLVFGQSHHKYGDGSVTAILNPDVSLVSELSSVCGYSVAILKEIVSKKCDLMVTFWVDMSTSTTSNDVASYISRTPVEAKFRAKQGIMLK